MQKNILFNQIYILQLKKCFMKRLMTRSNAHILASWGTQRYPQKGMDWIFLNLAELET